MVFVGSPEQLVVFVGSTDQMLVVRDFLEQLVVGQRLHDMNGTSISVIVQCFSVIFFQAYEEGYVLPNQYIPDLIGEPISMSAHLRFGCVSVRRFYWLIHDLFKEVPVCY